MVTSSEKLGLFAVALVLTSCTQPTNELATTHSGSQAEQSSKLTADESADADEVMAKSLTPTAFLEKLTSMKREPPEITLSPNFVHVMVGGSFPRNKWIALNDVKQLALLLGSTKPCLHVVSVISNSRAESYSTKGIEAAHMIMGYIDGCYPVNLPVDCPGWEKPMLKEVSDWLSKNHIPRKVISDHTK